MFQLLEVKLSVSRQSGSRLCIPSTYRTLLANFFESVCSLPRRICSGNESILVMLGRILCSALCWDCEWPFPSALVSHINDVIIPQEGGVKAEACPGIKSDRRSVKEKKDCIGRMESPSLMCGCACLDGGHQKGRSELSPRGAGVSAGDCGDVEDQAQASGEAAVWNRPFVKQLLSYQF
jgi:hypothetical protein